MKRTIHLILLCAVLALTAGCTKLDRSEEAKKLKLELQEMLFKAQKQQGAKYLMFIREKYTLSTGDEYMKETTAIAQMIQEMEGDLQASQALSATSLDDWFQDLKAKNEAFLQKMN